MAPLHPSEVLNVRAVLLSAPSGAAADTGQCGMPERERAAGASRPLLNFQLTSQQKGQWNPTRLERWNPIARCCPTRLCPGCTACTAYVHGLHGLFIGRKRRITPTRRERVEQESPLLVSLACFLPAPYLLPPSQHPSGGGADAPPLGD